MPITFSNLSGDLRLAQMISAELTLLIKDTSNLRNTNYLMYGGSVNGTGSPVVRIRKVGLYGRDNFSTPGTETGAVSEQALTDGHADIEAVRHSLRYDLSDLAVLTAYGNSPNEIEPFNIAASIAASYNTLFASLTADAASSFGTDAGNVAQDMSVSNFLNAVYTLEQADSDRGAEAPYVAVLHSKALTELQNSLRSETANIIANDPETMAMMGAKAGYAGKLFGVDIYKSSHINNDGTSYDNFMMARGAIGYCDGVPTIVGAGEFMQMDKVSIEFERTAAQALVSIVGHCFLGMGIIDDNKGCLISSQVA